jgi:hypothetical protein
MPSLKQTTAKHPVAVSALEMKQQCPREKWFKKKNTIF